MEATRDHELSAAYVLDALEPGEQRAFETHLGSCTVCAEELPSLRAAAAALAYAVESHAAPAALRTDLLGNLTEHRLAPVVPLWRRAALPFVSALAAGAAAAGIAVGLWPSGPSRERAVVVPIEGRAGCAGRGRTPRGRSGRRARRARSRPTVRRAPGVLRLRSA